MRSPIELHFQLLGDHKEPVELSTFHTFSVNRPELNVNTGDSFLRQVMVDGTAVYVLYSIEGKGHKLSANARVESFHYTRVVSIYFEDGSPAHGIEKLWYNQLYDKGA